MRRRDFVKTGALLAGAGSLLRPQMWADVPDHLWEGYPFGWPQVANRLDQGPFGMTRTKAGSRSSQPNLLASTFEILALDSSAIRGRKTDRRSGYSAAGKRWRKA
jgi:hypothetical protein